MNFIKKWFYNEFIDTWKGFKKEKIKPLTLILVIVNIVCLLVSNIIAAKTFTLFTIGGDLSVVLPTALILYPVVLIISDMLAQLDYKWTRRSCHLGFILNLFMVGVFELAIVMPGATDLSVLGSTGFMLLASMLSFYFGDLINDTVFLKLKIKDGDGNSKLFKRCVLSTFLGQLVDSSIFITFGMNLFPRLFLGFPFMSWAQVGLAILGQVIIKTTYEIIMSPIILKLCNKAKQADLKESEELVKDNLNATDKTEENIENN